MPPIKRPPHLRQRHFFREWRKFKNLSLEGAAERIEVDHSTLQRIEVGKSPYNQDLLEKLAMAYGCEPADLLTTDPLTPDLATPLFRKLQFAAPEIKRQALAVLEALLRTAT